MIPEGSFRPTRSDFGFAALIATVIAIVYWPVLQSPYVGDDWLYLSFFQRPLAEDLAWIMDPDKRLFLPGGGLFHRPFLDLYVWLSYALFGLSSVGYHVAAFVLHLGSSLLVAFIIWLLLGSRLLAWTTGALYASAAVVLMDPLLWCVGISPVGGAFCFLLSVGLYLVGKKSLSLISFLFALGFMESFIVLPFILLGYELCFRDFEMSVAAWVRRTAYRLWPYAACIAAYLVISGQSGTESFFRADDHPYKMALVGRHILTNGLTYAAWGLHSIVPLQLPLVGENPLFLGSIAVLVPASAVAVFCVVLFGWSRTAAQSRLSRSYAFLGSWCALGLVLPLLLANHLYRYHLIYSLPAFLACVTVLTRLALTRAGTASVWGVVTMLMLVSFSAVSNTAYVRESMDGTNRWPVVGTSRLPARSRTVTMILRDLKRLHPDLPHQATLIFSGVDLRAFWGGFGIGALYPRKAVRLYYARDLGRDSRGAFVKEAWFQSRDLPVPTEPLYLDPETTFFLRAEAGRLIEERD